MGRNVRVVGLDRLNKKLAALPGAAEAEIRTAMEAVAADMVRLARSLVPVSSGRLRQSIGWTWGTAPRGSISLGSVKQGRRGGAMTITVFAGNDEAYYARWVEFGTAPHTQGGIFKGATHPGTRAQPFFYPAFRALRKPMKQKARTAARRAARKVAKGTL